MSPIEKGQQVKFLCKSFLEDGTSFDGPDDSEPIEMEAGTVEGNAVAQTISQALIGMNFGGRKTINLTPDPAFGDIDTTKIVEVPKSEAHNGLKADDVVETSLPSGKKAKAVVRKIDSMKVTLDFNHPLAGHTINFEISVLNKEEQ